MNGEARYRLTTRHKRFMDTIVTIHIADAESSANDPRMEQAFEAFAHVERVCSRFRPDSELRRLCDRAGQPVVVSGLLFEAVRFAILLARETDGAFDPTIGRLMQEVGFDREYISGERTAPAIAEDEADSVSIANWKDVIVRETDRTITLKRPLVLDLGAVAKGLAVDLAALSLRGLPGFAIDAGGDVFVSGLNADGEPWRVGIRHPLQPDGNIAVLRLTDAAVCTSGGYERISRTQSETHHLLDPRTGRTANTLISSTVVAPYAMTADAYATAAFILGHSEGIALLEETGLDGMLIAPDMTIYTTSNFKRDVL